MANYPGGLDTFLTHSDNVRETIAAIHANSIQDSVLAIENTLGTNPQGSSTTVKDRLVALDAAVASAVANQGYSPPVATTTTRGILRLSGDLSGTADAPRLTALNNLATISYADAPRRVLDMGQVSGAVNLDLSLGYYFKMTAVGNITITVSGWNTKVLFQSVLVQVVQDGTGGRTVTWPTRFSTNSTTSGIATTAGSYALYEFASMDIGATVSLWAQPAFSVPITADRFDSAVLNLSSLRYYWATEETSGTTVLDSSSGGNASTYTGTFSLNNALTVPTSGKLTPLFASGNSNYIAKDSVRFAAATAAWSLGFTLKAPDPGLSSFETIYSETLSTDNTTGQGFYIEAAGTALSGGKTAAVVRLTNSAGTDVFKKTLTSALFDNSPHFVVISFDGGNTYSIYVDGLLADTVVQTPTATTVDRATWGARRRLSTDRYFSGNLGRIWARNAVTTQAEVSTLTAAFNNSSPQNPPTPTPGGTFDNNGVKMATPVVSVNNGQATVTVQVDWNKTVPFTYLQIAVRPPAGSGGTAFGLGYTPGTRTGTGTTTIFGTGVCDVSGVWTAFGTYSLATSPVQADWVDGPQVSFTVATVAPPTPGTGGGGTPGTAILGMSGPLTPSGQNDSWIGKAVDISGTWCDGAPTDQINLYTIQPGNEHGSWNKYLDLAIGAIWHSSGETWAQAANGNYDARWTQCLNNIKSYWGSRDTSKLFIRFAHEFNLQNDWSVSGSDATAFKAAWVRFRNLQKQILPLAKLVWCPNDGTNGGLGLNVNNAFPGTAYVDVYGIDTYNQYPFSTYTSQSDFNNYLNRTDSTGPVGPEAHRLKALEYGIPMCFGEWSSCGDPGGQGGGGDSPGYINKMFDWIFAHQGTGAGNFLYAVQFNLWNQFTLNPTSLQPNAANAFKARMLSRT